MELLDPELVALEAAIVEDMKQLAAIEAMLYDSFSVNLEEPVNFTEIPELREPTPEDKLETLLLGKARSKKRQRDDLSLFRLTPLPPTELVLQTSQKFKITQRRLHLKYPRILRTKEIDNLSVQLHLAEFHEFKVKGETILLVRFLRTLELEQSSLVVGETTPEVRTFCTRPQWYQLLTYYCIETKDIDRLAKIQTQPGRPRKVR